MKVILKVNFSNQINPIKNESSKWLAIHYYDVEGLDEILLLEGRKSVIDDFIVQMLSNHYYFSVHPLIYK